MASLFSFSNSYGNKERKNKPYDRKYRAYCHVAQPYEKGFWVAGRWPCAIEKSVLTHLSH